MERGDDIPIALWRKRLKRLEAGGKILAGVDFNRNATEALVTLCEQRDEHFC